MCLFDSTVPFLFPFHIFVHSVDEFGRVYFIFLGARFERRLMGMEREAQRLQSAIAKKNSRLNTYKFRELHQRYFRAKELARHHFIHSRFQDNPKFNTTMVNDEEALRYCLNAGIHIPDYISREDYMLRKSALFTEMSLSKKEKERLITVSTHHSYTSCFFKTPPPLFHIHVCYGRGFLSLLYISTQSSSLTYSGEIITSGC